jgi:pimeloyl-ACP methyl ester carboxylesterase
MRKRSSQLFLTAACAFLATASLHAIGFDFDSNGVRIHYLDEGEGEPVLLIHGYTATATLNWGIPGILKNLAVDHRVIALDNRGHGRSDKPEDMEDYGAQMVEDAVRLLDHLGIESAHVVGYSMGGMITLKMSVTHPDRMRSAVIGGMGWTRLDDETHSRYEGSTARQTSPALTACFKRFWELGITEEELAAVKVPMTVLVGTKDRLLQRSVEPLQQVRPDIPVVLVEGATHASCVFKPDFREGIRSFLEAQAAAD